MEILPLNLFFLFSCIIWCLNYSISYSYPSNKLWMLFRLSMIAFSCCCSEVSLSKCWFCNGGLISGLNALSTFFSRMAYQSTSFSQIWDFTSFGPLRPRRLAGLRYSDLLMKSAASILQPSGRSLFFKHICFEKMLSLISFLFLPKYGLLPIMNSNVITPRAK